MAELNQESILALDNIRLDLPIAGAGVRCLAATVDAIWVGVLDLLWLLLCVAIGARLGSRWGLMLLIVGFFLLEWGYFSVMEIATGGRTLGKMILHLRVVTAEGAAPGAGALLLRNLVRDVDLFVGLPLMAVDPLARRVGDRLAGTLVVHDRRDERPPQLGRVPPSWGAREVAIVEGFLAREAQLVDAVARDDMARQLLGRLRRDAPDMLAGVDIHDPAGGPVAALRRALEVREG